MKASEARDLVEQNFWDRIIEAAESGNLSVTEIPKDIINIIGKVYLEHLGYAVYELSYGKYCVAWRINSD